VTGGEPRNAHRFRPRCRFLLALTRFSRPRYLLRCATSADCSDGVLVAINVHGSEDQEKDASSAERERHVSVFLASGACASKSACGRRSLPRRPLDIRCRRCVRREGRRPVLAAGPNQDPRSDADPRRSTPSRGPGCLPPLRPRQASARRIAPPNESCAPVPRSRRPHVLHELWRGAFTGLASARVRSPAIPGNSRNKRLCYRWDRSFRISRAWD
jgi:hypothetical protein